MLLSDAFDRMKLHVDLLPRPQLREHDVLVRRPRQVAREDGLLFALWNPHQVAAGDFIVYIWLCAAFWCPFARYLQPMRISVSKCGQGMGL